MTDPFGRFGSFGAIGALRSSLFGAKDPFDDPFFSKPFEDLLEPYAFSSGVPSSNVQNNIGEKGVTIEELQSEEEAEDGGEDTENKKRSDSAKHPSVEHPEDDDATDAERKIQNVNQRSDFNRKGGTPSRAHTFRYHTCKVTYGGIDGAAYYTSTRTRRADSEGTVIEESKEADKTTGEATHRISRGIHDKGHSVTRKLNSDGRVDTAQTLHNLNEDELSGFEEAWKGDLVGRLLAGWTDGFSSHGTTGWEQERERSWRGLCLPSMERARRSSGRDVEGRAEPDPSGSGAKKVVRINID